MGMILKTDGDDEERERRFELDYLRSLTTAERFEMMIRRSNEIKEILIRNGHRIPVEIVKRYGKTRLRIASVIHRSSSRAWMT